MTRQKEFESTLKRVLNKVNKNRNILKRGFPHITERGAWETTKDGYWTGGLLGRNALACI